MAINNESFNVELYDLLKVRGYEPVPLNSKNQRVNASQKADVIEFNFKKDGKDYGKAWVSLDNVNKVTVYFDEEQSESPNQATPGVDYDDSWTGLLKHIKNWAQRRQLSFELKNKDRLSDDMRQRDYYKMKAKIAESYHPMGKKASYNDAVPNVKIVIQHNRALEEGEQRFRNIAKIYLENVDGERFLAPTTRPGLARVYARHIAEGGLPNDERWGHLKSICEEYNKMAGFVRATRNKQFNESAQQLVNEGINHYSNLRETLTKLTGHRGYNAYFESWTPALMEEEGDTSINELFVQETLDPRIESVMPILSRLRKRVSEMSEVKALGEWADDIISEKLEISEEETIPTASEKEKLRANRDKERGYTVPLKPAKEEKVDEATGWYSEKHPQHDRMTKDGYKYSVHDIKGKKMHRYYKPGSLTDIYKYDDQEKEKKVDESSEERPYVCVHAKKGKCEVTGKSSYEAAKKAAEKWKLKSTAGIDAHLKDVSHKTSELEEATDLKSIPEKSIKEEIQSFKVKVTTEDGKSKEYIVKADSYFKAEDEAKKQHTKLNPGQKIKDVEVLSIVKQPGGASPVGTSGETALEKATRRAKAYLYNKDNYAESELTPVASGHKGLNSQQKRVGQVPGTEKAKTIKGGIGKPNQPHPFQGRLVGASESDDGDSKKIKMEESTKWKQDLEDILKIVRK